MTQATPLTTKGLQKLRSELDHLKKSERPRIIQAISEARAHGDLRENAEYHAAKEQQGFVEKRIKFLEHKLSVCQVIDISNYPNEGKVIFGAIIKLLDTGKEREVTYQIVGEEEADIKEMTISVTSPLARALIGKYEGDEVIVRTPDGNVSYEILEVSYQ